MGIKQLRMSVIIALLMAVVAGVSLATATYAWFVNNAAPSMAQINFSSTTATSLSIAVHKSGATTANQSGLNYKGILTNDDIKDYKDKVHLKAVSTVNTSHFYGCDLFDEGGSNQAKTFTTVADGDGFYLALPLWFSATKAMDVYLKDNTSVTVTGTGYNAYMDRAVLLGFREDSDDSGTFSRSIIYEPNSAADMVGRANTTAEDYLNNPITADKLGISSIVTEDGANKGKIKTVAAQDRKSFVQLAIAAVSGQVIVPASTIDASKIALFHIDAGIPKKITFYLWLDGMDYDCISAVSGGTINVSLNFIGAEAR